MVVHEHDDVLAAVRASYPEAADVARVYSDDATQWWVTDANHDTFAYAWYEATVLNTRLYIP